MPVTVTILLFARPKEIVGSPSITVSVDERDATVRTLKLELARLYPDLGSLLGTCHVSVNETLVDDDCQVTASDEVALIPPVSGG